MTVVEPSFLEQSNRGEGARPRTPWLLTSIVVILTVLPPYLTVRGNSFTSPIRLILMALFGTVVIGFVFSRKSTTAKTVNPGILFVVGYLVIELFLHAINSTSYLVAALTGGSAVSDNVFEHLGTLLACGGIALYALLQITNEWQRSVILGGLAIGLAYMCIVGALQSYADIDLRLLLKLPGMYETTQLGRPAGSPNAPVIARFGTPRAYSTANHPGAFAVMAAMLVLLSVHFVRYAKSSWVKFLSFVAIPIGLVGILAAGSRVGILLLTAGFLVYMWSFALKDIVATLLVGAAAISLAIVAFPESAQTLWTVITLGTAGQDPSVEARLDDYAAVAEVFQQHPVFGLGFGYNAPPASDGSLDNQWLLSLTQGGLTGVAALLVVVVAIIFGLATSLRYAVTPKDRNQRFVIGAILVGLIASTTTSDFFRDQQVVFLTFLLLGLLWSGIAVPIDGRMRVDSTR